MKITIDNRDLQHVHIDTYQMLDSESFTESEIEYLREQHNDDTLDYESFDWAYNNEQIVKDFAHASINELLQGIKDENGEDCIKGINYISSTSPKFYNYTTDSYTMAVDIDVKKVTKYIDDNHAAIVEKASSYDGIISKENMQHAAICHIIDNAITSDDYDMALWEVQNEVYSNNVTIVKI